MENRFTTFSELLQSRQSRLTVLFGAGNIAHKTLRKLDDSPECIVDNNPNMWNTEQIGLQVLPPETLKGTAEKNFVIITTTSFDEVGAQLQGYGFEPGRDFAVSPIMNELRIISELEAAKANLIFTSGAPCQESATAGGGIYEIELDGEEWNYRKVFDGTTHGVTGFDGKFVATHHERGLIEIDKNYNLLRAEAIPAATRPHGVAYCEETDQFFVGASNRDSVLVFDKDLKPSGEIPIFEKYATQGDPNHHVNDVCAIGGSLFVSMFSWTGNWKKDVFDGIVLEIDAATRKIVGPVIQDLWMPHNVEFMEGSLTVLDSLRGQLKRENAIPVGQFPGFARGLAYDGQFYFIGQSKNRNFSRYMGLSMNISMDTSIIVFDQSTKVSRSLSMPPKLSEIHSIRVMT